MGLIRIVLIGTMTFALMLHSGCSFLFVKGPPAKHAQMATFECSESNAWPALDLIWAGLNGLGAVTAAGDDENPQQGQIVGIGLAWLVVSGASAIYGFSKVSECGGAKRGRDERHFGTGVAVPAPVTRPAPSMPSAAGGSPRAPAAAGEPAAAPPPGGATPAPAGGPDSAPAQPVPGAPSASGAPASGAPAPAGPGPAATPAPGAAPTVPVLAPPSAPATPSSTPGAALPSSGRSGVRSAGRASARSPSSSPPERVRELPPARRSLAMRRSATADRGASAVTLSPGDGAARPR
jgi:hypothetical protein